MKTREGTTMLTLHSCMSVECTKAFRFIFLSLSHIFTSPWFFLPDITENLSQLLLAECLQVAPLCSNAIFYELIEQAVSSCEKTGEVFRARQLRLLNLKVIPMKRNQNEQPFKARGHFVISNIRLLYLTFAVKLRYSQKIVGRMRPLLQKRVSCER